jgi:hypothetical protein
VQPEPRGRPQGLAQPRQELAQLQQEQQPAQRQREPARQRLEPQALPLERQRVPEPLLAPNRPAGQPGQVESDPAPQPNWLCRAIRSAPLRSKQLLAYCRLLIRVMRLQDCTVREITVR